MNPRSVLHKFFLILLVTTSSQLRSGTVLSPKTGTIGAIPGLAQRSPQVQIYSYDFESGTAGWTLESGVWARVPYAGGHALLGTGHGFARLTSQSGDTTSLSFRFRLEDLQSSLHANVYENFTSGHARYLVSFGSNGIGISRQQGSSFQDMGLGFVPISPEVFHDARIMVGGGSIDVFLDGDAAVGVDDPVAPPPGYISFESLDNSTVYIDDVEVQIGPEPAPHPRAPRPPLSVPPGPDVGPFVNGSYTGDINLTGNNVLTLSQGRYTVKSGNIKLKDNSRLIIQPDAVLVFDRGTSPLIHWGVDLNNASAMEVNGGNVIAPGGTLVRIHVFGTSSIVVHDAKPWIHFINAGGNATVSLNNTRFVTSIGGSIQLADQAFAEIYNSQVGAIALSIPAGSSLTATGLKPGIYTSFDLQKDLNVSGIGYNLLMNNVEIVEDTLGEGPFERGWVIFSDENATTQINNSTLRKIVLQMPASGSNFKVTDLELNKPTNFSMGSVNLNNVTVTGQWGFFIHGTRQATFENCDGLWFFLFDTVQVMLKDSTMNEFDPRSYTGMLTFDNSEWRTAGEIIKNNDFWMVGTATMNDPNLRQSISWSQSAVTRRFPIIVRAPDGKPIPGTTVTLTRGSNIVTATTGLDGQATVDLRFTDQDYKGPWQLKANTVSTTRSVDFFTTTPIILRETRLFFPAVITQQ